MFVRHFFSEPLVILPHVATDRTLDHRPIILDITAFAHDADFVHANPWRFKRHEEILILERRLARKRQLLT